MPLHPLLLSLEINLNASRLTLNASRLVPKLPSRNSIAYVSAEHCRITERRNIGIGTNAGGLSVEPGHEYPADGRLREQADQRERHLEFRHDSHSGPLGPESV